MKLWLWKRVSYKIKLQVAGEFLVSRNLNHIYQCWDRESMSIVIILYYLTLSSFFSNTFSNLSWQTFVQVLNFLFLLCFFPYYLPNETLKSVQSFPSYEWSKSSLLIWNTSVSMFLFWQIGCNNSGLCATLNTSCELIELVWG